MTFGDFSQALFPFCGDGRRTADFVVVLVDNIMEEPSNESDKRKANDGEYNPLVALQPDALKRLHNGSRNISAKAATVILGHLDKRKFDDFIFGFSLDALTALCAKLREYGVDANAQNVGEVCADLFEGILKSCVIATAKRQASNSEVEFADEIAPDLASPRIPQAQLSTVYIRDGQIHIGATTIKLPERLLPPEKIDKIEMGYIPKLLEAYTDAEKVIEVTQANLPEFQRYQRNFTEQRENYYNAVYIFERVRGVFSAEDGDQFDILKKETYFGISDVYADDYDNGFARLTAVLKQAAVIDVSKSLLSNIGNLIGISEKKGVCHILVSEGTIPSWVVVL
ncbi:MAG: hypothetical protein LBN97_04365 [Oscillospiraceae bacterium]|jgi:hypothetical protein|nr:hypothetical protein [Oscillospiraceae bacterium]